MLSRLLTVRLKTAENALREGRLDDAFRLATTPDIREHRRAVAVLRDLTDRFLQRADGHFKADRFAEALIDLAKAEAGGIRQEEIAELREQVRTVAEEELRKETSRRLRLEAANRRIEAGSLRAGHRILEPTPPDDPQAKALRQKINDRQQHAADTLEDVEALLAGGQISQAVERLSRAKASDPRSLHVAKMEGRLTDLVLTRVGEAIEAGRLSRAADELQMLGSLGADLPQRREAVEMVEYARRAADALQQYQIDDARREIIGLRHLLPKSGWVSLVDDQLRQLDDLLLGLRAGPLGQSMRGPNAAAARGGKAPAGRPAVASLEETVAMTSPVMSGDLPDRLLLLVDGGGSYLVHRGGRVTIGRAASGHPADVAIFSDLAERHAEIACVDDDYFIFATREVEVAGRMVRHKLLCNGDRVVLGRRAKFTFRLPNRKSGSAVLDISDSTRMPHDVRRVVLMRNSAMIGFGSSVHVSCNCVDRDLVLYEQAGRLWIRPQDRPSGEARPVALGGNVELGGVSMVVQAWPAQSPGSRVI
jgi:tetratricopeptide (TPR) repeat protein